ncbi:MAG: saccharopine dehydrogenase, partial [Hyphomicrobiaceae bacterium]
GLGQPFRMKRGGAWITVHGWQGLSRHRFPDGAWRWMGYCNVPDLMLFPERYPDLKTVDFRAGVEVTLFHLGLWALSWPGRFGLMRRPDAIAAPLLAIKRRLPFLGSDVGGMFVELEGVDAGGSAKRIVWHLVARQGHGPYIPTTPAVVLAKKLVRGDVMERGARACVGLVTLPEIERELADLAITMSER